MVPGSSGRIGRRHGEPLRAGRGARRIADHLPPATREGWRRYLGRKISIRYSLRDDPSHPFSEAIGVIASVAPDASSIQVITRKAATVTVATDDVIAGKVFD